MNKTRLIIVRHAEAEGNYKRLFHGWSDGEITEKGHIQAAKAAERLKDIRMDVLYSSSLKRTIQTAGYISKLKNLPIIRTDKLKEINGGDWEGEPWDVLPKKWPQEYHTWENTPHLHSMPNGENMEEFQKRLIDEIMHIISMNKGRHVGIVTHGTAIKALLCYFEACELEAMFGIKWCDNTGITIVDYEDEKFNLIMEGDSSHLGDELSTVKNQDWWDDYVKKLEDKK